MATAVDVGGRRFPRTWFVFTEAEGDNPAHETSTKRKEQGENEGGIVVYLAYDGNRETGQEVGRVAWDRTLKQIPKDMQKITFDDRLAQVLSDAEGAVKEMNKKEEEIAKLLEKEDTSLQVNLDGLRQKISTVKREVDQKVATLKAELDKEIQTAAATIETAIGAQNKKIEELIKEQDKKISTLVPKSKSKGLT